jgi:hypothetical protein
LPYARLAAATDLPAALAGSGLRVVEVATNRADGAKLRAAINEACAAAITATL